jgi:prepilin-type N-terminal cleavage/methylation domain-containing protein
MKKTKLKGFTLLEMLIVIVIIWILAVVLCESYITISKIALRVEQEKNLSEESLVLTQIFQSIADEATIDYDKYENSLKESGWFTGVLYLTWWQRTWTSIYTKWEDFCLDLDWNFPQNADGWYDDYSQKVKNALTWCVLVLEKEVDGDDSIITPLTNQWKVITSKVLFKVIPYNSEEYYFGDGNWSPETIMDDLHQPAFWVFMHLYAPLYQPVWTNKIDQPLQLFFNLSA